MMLCIRFTKRLFFIDVASNALDIFLIKDRHLGIQLLFYVKVQSTIFMVGLTEVSIC